MGDRANVYVFDKSYGGVYLYTHWEGTELPEIVQRALAKRWRWADTQYLTRIIFCEIVRGNEDGETGYGISAQCGDGEERIIAIDVDNQRISNGIPPTKEWARYRTFEEFVDLTQTELKSFLWG